MIMDPLGIWREVKDTTAQLDLKWKYANMVFHYGRIQMADLYAHFSPVEWILEPKLLNKNPDFADELGNASIWDRIKKAGEDMFYRVEYSKKATTEKQKRKEDKVYVEKKGKGKLIDTSIADNAYVHNVIKAYVEGEGDCGKYLYDEKKK